MTDPGDLIGIGTYSMMTRLTRRALHLYEERGILVPRRKEITGYRYYDLAQIPRGIQLRQLADMGFGLQEMAGLLEAMSNGDLLLVEEMVKGKREEVDAEIDRLETVMASLREERFHEVMRLENSQAGLKEIKAQRVLSGRRKGRYSEGIPALIHELYGIVSGPAGQNAMVKVVGTPIFICHDEEYRENDADIEVALPITGKVEVPQGFEIKTLEGMRVACKIHKGAYGNVGMTYKDVMEFIEEKGMSPCGPSREVYLNDPHEVPESELLTEVQIPVE